MNDDGMDLIGTLVNGYLGLEQAKIAAQYNVTANQAAGYATPATSSNTPASTVAESASSSWVKDNGVMLAVVAGGAVLLYLLVKR